MNAPYQSKPAERLPPVPAHLLKLLWRPFLRFGYQPKPEDAICIAFSDRLRGWSLDGSLRAIWTHIPNELGGGVKNAALRYVLAKAVGMVPGAADYVFIWPEGGAWLEAKTRHGHQNEAQRWFKRWCDEADVTYRIFRSADEGEAILRELGALREPTRERAP